MPSPGTPPAQTEQQVIELPQPPGKKASDYLGAYKGIAYAAIVRIASDVASMKLHLYRRKMVRGKMEFEEILEHESLSLLDHVNSFATGYDLLEATQTFLETTGEAFWLMLRDASGRPVEIWTLRPDWVTIIPSKTRVVQAYRFTPGGYADYIDFKPEDVIHFRYFNPKNSSRGIGGVQAAAMEIDLDDFMAGYTRNFFFNSAVPSMILKFKEKLNPQQLKRFMEQWRSQFGGVRQAHKIGVVTGDVEIEKLSQEFEKMGMTEQRKYSRDEILAIFGVPKSVVGITEDVNRANAEATLAAYMERTIDPKMMKLVVQLNEFFLREWNSSSGEDLFFDYDDPIPADRELQLKTYESGLKNGWLMINEVRESENLEPVEGGDVIYLPFSLTAIGNLGKVVTDAGEKLMKLFGKDKGDVVAMLPLKNTKSKLSLKDFHVRVPARRLKDLRKSALEKNLKPQLVKMLSRAVQVSENETKKEAYWKKLISKTDVWEGMMTDKVNKLFDEQQNIIGGKIEVGRKAVEDEVVQYLYDLEAEDVKWKNELDPLFKNILKQQGRDTLDFIGFKEDLDLTQKTVIAFLEQKAGEMIHGINKFTLQQLRISLAEGVRDGEGIQSLKSRVENIFDNARGKRAEVIARTEVLRASNFATVEAYKQSGVVKGKEWLTALDERVCPTCQPLDGKIVEVNKEFKTDVGDLDYPPAHPSCRCTTIPVIV